MKRLYDENEVSEAFDLLYPICRSILGEGYRESFSILQQYIPLEEEIFYTGEKVLNWTVPQEWVIRAAWIEDASGNRIIDFKDNNLHVVNYSEPVDAVLDLEELKEHIYTSAVDENAVPYTISYYKKRWGFCMSQKQLNALPEGKYHAFIDSEFVDGTLVVGQAVLPGKSEKEILLTSYLCHPSMANNELSGPLVLAMLYQRIKEWKERYYTYRFLVNPETIGSIAYLSRHGEELKQKLHAGLVFTCLGGNDKNLRYKKSRMDSSPFNCLVSYLNSITPETFRVEEFRPTLGSDERQYCSPGFNLPMGQMSRMVYGRYKEYHTSLDTKELMGIENIIDSCDKIENFLRINEQEQYYVNKYPFGEIKLGDYDLYPSVNSDGSKSDDEIEILNDPKFHQSVMMILNYADGQHPLSYCAMRLNMELDRVQRIAQILVDRGLLEEEKKYEE